MPYSPPQCESNLDPRAALNEHLVLRTQDCDKIARLLIRHGADVNVEVTLAMTMGKALEDTSNLNIHQ